MASVKNFDLGFKLSPTPSPPSLSCQKRRKATLIRDAEFRMIGSTNKANLYQRKSRVETMNLGGPACIGSQYHYRRATRVGHKSENSCSYCGKPAPSILEVFRNLHINKHLDLVQSGPLLANLAAPAPVHSYWCPEI
jgi:hypothetical protein